MIIAAFGSLSCTINAIHSGHYAHKIDTYVLQSLYRAPQQNGRHSDRTDKMDLNDLCQTFVSSRPKDRKESLFGK